MRILHLDSGREMRGGQWQVLRLLEGLRNVGVTGTLLSPAASPLFDRASDLALDVRPLNLWGVAALSRKADLVHAHDAGSHTLGALLSASPLIVSRRVAFPVQNNPASRWKYGRATHYAAVSEFVKQVLLKYGIPGSKVTVVYDGVPLREEIAQGEQILAPASQDPSKGTILALEAARIAGTSLHFSSDLESDLRRARLFLYITHCEGLGSGVLLAMAAGVPVVASGVGGLTEIIEDGNNGLLTENRPESIAAAIRRLIGNPLLAQTLAARARQTVRERFSMERLIGSMVHMYNQVLSPS